MDSWMNDLRLALRSLRQRPLFAAVVTLSLAIGLGAFTAVFSVISSLLLEPVPGVGEPDRVVEIGRTNGGRGFDTVSWTEYLALRRGATPLEHVAGWTLLPVSLSTGGEGERAFSLMVTSSYFAAVGVEPAMGRFFLPEEEAVDAGPVVVLGHDHWRNRFGADPGIIGREIEINRRRMIVVGVGPAGFRGHTPVFSPDFYLPLGMMPVASPRFGRGAFEEPRASWFQLVGRLAVGATVPQADAAVKSVFAALAQPRDEPGRARSARVIELGPVPGFGRAGVTGFLAILLGVAVLVMTIACSNVAGMLLARGAARDREMAIRLALGSGRLRLVRQLLIEVLVLFTAGGIAGAALAGWATSILGAARLPVPIPIRFDFTPGAGVLAAGLGMALLTGLVFGLARALQATSAGPSLSLRSETTRTGRRSSRARRAFLVAQLALSVILLVSAGLFLRSLQRAAAIRPGFDPGGVATLMLDLSLDGYDEERGRVFFARLLERLASLPGASGAAIATDLPLDFAAMERMLVTETGPASQEPGLGSAFNFVSPEYFRSLRIAVLEGRGFDGSDVPEGELVAVVSRGFADYAWPGEPALGKRLRLQEEPGAWRTVVGVVDDVKNQYLAERTGPMFYLPLAQAYDPAVNVLVRGTPGTDLGRPLVAAIRELDPQLALTEPQRLEAVTALGILPQRIGAAVTSALGLIALLLSALGVYGLIAFLVAQRTFEMGVRAALGARRPDILRLVLSGALRMTLPGLALGLLGAFALGRLMRGFILGVAPADPVTFLAMPLVLLLAVTIASLIPARRAAAISPLAALHSE
jgi:predicted permease